jgi:hypothetical protein
VRKKKVGKYEYYQLVEGRRENGKVIQRVIFHLGRHETPEAALAYLQESAEQWRQQARDHLRGAQLIRERAVRPVRRGRTWWWRLPSENARGWFNHPGSAEDAEREAQEYLVKAGRLDERAERLRSVL